MIKRLTCIVLLLMYQPCLSAGKTKSAAIILYSAKLETSFHFKEMGTDTILKNGKKREREEKK